ncbi:MAG: hypothetical protein OXD47_11250 [Gammaproteobacteria bacterium]|nr:hypothetical protein [Gammaproteobacteria bacterium]MCY4210841.1 hypothetical protein [Gammaproteobacteria bacterium]MCY4281907.1 hypothetical protein [Gammaproteobacteria bacterium]MCY4339349.1 hypothetical protein [Gammaproteobacteria bacterium]
MSQDSWLFINSFAPWLSAVGTIAAVVATIYFAKRGERVRLKISAGHRLLVGQGMPEPFPEYLCIRVVNIGYRDTNVKNIGWKVRLFKKRYAVQNIVQNQFSSKLPVLLRQGEEVNYLIPINKETNWLKRFCLDMLMPNPQVHIHFVKIWVTTSVGITFESKIESSLKKKLKELIDT